MSLSAPATLIALAALCAAGTASAQQIFICTDAHGRRLTSDRPILECIDREQRVLSSTGAPQRTLPPSYTAAERAGVEAKARAQSEERSRQAEDRQRQRALLIRFPNQELLDHERATALARVDEVIATADQGIVVLEKERQKLESEAASHGRDGKRTPASLLHAIEENERQHKAQRRQVLEHQQERAQVNQQFDRMQSQLNTLWQQQRASAR